SRERGIRGLLGGRSMLVQETGDDDLDGITIEYAGLLVRRGREEDAYRALFETLGRKGRWHALRISASTQARAIAATLPTGLRAYSMIERPSYFVDLAALRAAGEDHLAAISSSTRSGLRRTRRAYEHRGPISIAAATEPALALAWLEELRVLHERYWRSKGKRGSFGSAFFAAFHEDLVGRTCASGFSQLLRITAGDVIVGYLYNLVWRNRVYFYNAGLNYGALEKQDRPGFLAHMVAIQKYLDDGMEIYDFLAGDGDYKRMMSTHARTVNWIQVRRPGWRLALESLGALAGKRSLGVPLVAPTPADIVSLRD
ncbi:MAG TPA: GNAT family N-acetyltransferase, partial [Rhodanobacteraceae bacterium]